MSERARDEDGQFVETVTQERVLTVLREADAPVLTSKDIADELGCTSEAVNAKLKGLREHDRVDRRRVGARAVVWWLTEQTTLDNEGTHDADDAFFAGIPLDLEGGRRVEVADTDELLGDVLAEDDSSPEAPR